MAQVRDYMGYLEERYGFAPVNSQEEVFAAQTIAEVLEEHKLSTTTEEFSAPAWGKRLYGVPMIGLFVAAILFFFTGIPRTVGIVLLLLCAALLIAYRLQLADPLSNLGPKAQSQNVVAVRPASGVAEGERPGRPIVILAHYDTGREELLASPGLSPWRARITQAATFTVPAIVLLALISLIPAVPTTARYVLVALALVASIPTLIWGISDITALTGPLTAGSVDNKSSIAAMLSIADKVCYGVAWHPDRRQLRARRFRDEEPKPEENAEVSNEEAIAALEAERAAAEGAEEAPLDVPEAPEPVRHGAELIRDLGILPESCEIVYVEAEPEPQPEAAAPAEPLPEPEALYFDEADDDYDDQFEDDIADSQQPAPQRAPEPADDWGSSDFDIDAVPATRRNAFFDLPDPSVAAVDPLSVRRTSASAARPVNSADFSAADFRDGTGSMNVSYSSAQAGAAYDDDQFETPAASAGNFEVLHGQAGMGSAVAEGTRKEYKRGAGVLSKLFGHREDEAAEIPRGNVRAQDSITDWLGVDDEFDVTDDTSWDLMDDGGWKGGAARSDKLRFVPMVEERPEPELVPEEDDFADLDEGLAEDAPEPAVQAEPVHKDPSATVNDIFAEEEAAAEEEAMRSLDADIPAEPEEDVEADASGLDELADPAPSAGDYNEDLDYELREAITAMGDSDLQSHDIWFVAVGASELDHAGADEFIEAHRRELRGAFVINLSCVGAGDTTVITDEGIVPHRRSDRRLVRHILASADDLHIPVSRASVTWGDTDAMPVMRRSMRAATIMGCSTQGIPALSHTRNDLPGTPDKRLIADVVELVAETIRRS